MKNNIFRMAVIAMLPAVAMTSCKFEEANYFGESPALRIETMSNEIQSILTKQSAPEKHGWLMQYFVNGYQNDDNKDIYVEGFNIFARFDKNGTVTLGSDHRFLRDGQAKKYTEATSLYSMLLEESVVIAFNSWSDVLTPLTDPVNPAKAPSVIEKDGVGMGGDNNLVVTSYNENEIILRGERYLAPARLIALDRPVEDYRADVAAVAAKVANKTITTYYLVNGADTMYVTGGMSAGVPVVSERLVGGLNTKYLPCVFTPKGFRLNKAVEVGEAKADEFILVEEKGMLVSENGMQCIPMWDSYIATHNELWTLDETMFTAEQQQLLADMNDEIKKHNTAWSVKSLSIGKSSSASGKIGLVVTFYTNTQKSKTNVGGIQMNINRTGYAEVTIENPETPVPDNNMKTVTTKAKNMTNLAGKFAQTLAGVYTATPDNPFLPTGATMEPKGTGTAFKMTK